MEEWSLTTCRTAMTERAIPTQAKSPLPPSLVPSPAPTPPPLPTPADVFEEIVARTAAPAQPAGVAIKEEPTTLDQLRRFAAGGYLYGLMDATDQILVPHKAKELGPAKAISLFSGTAKEQYWQVAPYLFHVDPALLDWIIAKLWKEPWGIFAVTKAKFEDLRVHFKKFLLAQLPDGKVWYFRYYDPRILKAYLPVCDPWELQKFFGPIRAFAIAGGEEEKPTMVQGLNAPPPPPSAQPEATVWWKIRPEQGAAFDHAAQENFVKRVIGHANEFFPDECHELGPDGLRSTIQYCIKQAGRYGISSGVDVCRYVDIALGLGRDFDRDPKHPWAASILNDKRLSPEGKLSKLLGFVAEMEEAQ